MTWWLIPLLATLAAWVWTRVEGRTAARSRRRPEPGTPADAADLARFARALARPLPGGPHG